MPLHDWSDDFNWSGMHTLWITEILRWVKPRLPKDYRAYVGTLPYVAIAFSNGKPDMTVRKLPHEDRPTNGPPVDAMLTEPDVELRVATLNPPDVSMFVEFHGRMVAAVEIVSPGNKDRPESRANYATRYAGYLHQGVHLMLLDALPKPYGFSFADAIAASLKIDRPTCPTPMAVAYRVGESYRGQGTVLAIWQRSLHVGSALPALPLPLDVHHEVLVDLEATYMRAAADAYLA